MPRNWMTIRVELIGGLDIECDPPPGRTMIVGPRHTFAARRPSMRPSRGGTSRTFTCSSWRTAVGSVDPIRIGTFWTTK